MSNNSGVSHTHGKVSSSGINYNGSKAYAYLQKKGGSSGLMNQTNSNNLHNNGTSNISTNKSMINAVSSN